MSDQPYFFCDAPDELKNKTSKVEAKGRLLWMGQNKSGVSYRLVLEPVVGGAFRVAVEKFSDKDALGADIWTRVKPGEVPGFILEEFVKQYMIKDSGVQIVGT